MGEVPYLVVPVALFLGTGLGLLLAVRRSNSRTLLRLAATFVALWALLATTLLLGVLSMGGWPAILRLLRAPLTLLDPEDGRLWLFGALGAFGVLLLAFCLNQLVGRGLRRVLPHRELPWPEDLPRPHGRVSLLAFESARADAFSFALLEAPGGGRGFHRHELIFLSEPLLSRLDPEERTAVVAHELGHVRDLDARYLTFLRTLARMMRWDPVLAYLARALTRHEEYRADEIAARTTRRPRALASAIYKAALAAGPGGPGAPRGATGLLGVGGPRGRADVLARIERLLALADTAEFRQEPRVP
jgi:Zn-dependent protease with chaperone function